MFILTFAWFWGFIVLLDMAIANTPKYVSEYPKGHVHEYDPTGEYTYKHQNPRFQ